MGEIECILYLFSSHVSVAPLMYFCGLYIFGNLMYIVNIINEMDCSCIFLSPLDLLYVFSCVIAQGPAFLELLCL